MALCLRCMSKRMNTRTMLGRLDERCGETRELHVRAHLRSGNAFPCPKNETCSNVRICSSRLDGETHFYIERKARFDVLFGSTYKIAKRRLTDCQRTCLAWHDAIFVRNNSAFRCAVSPECNCTELRVSSASGILMRAAGWRPRRPKNPDKSATHLPPPRGRKTDELAKALAPARAEALPSRARLRTFLLPAPVSKF